MEQKNYGVFGSAEELLRGFEELKNNKDKIMDRHEQIVELAMIISGLRSSQNICQLACKTKCKEKYIPLCPHYELAKTLVMLGYGNMRIFFEDLCKRIESADCQITIDTSDVKKIAKKFGFDIEN